MLIKCQKEIKERRGMGVARQTDNQCRDRKRKRSLLAAMVTTFGSPETPGLGHAEEG